ncbi:hypothetical protein AWC14_22210 [Mycobacterium kyorinense]|uniref:Uncharacterized protein n=2 Tax=Mycobacterium kyorinense TaxID=487514 RepID=A0A1X1YD79_9MYCO|nr:hypothetical protein AWC14_22210 [Mycobacterium kyorinense]
MLRMPGVSVSTECGDCQVSFISDDQSFHLRQDDNWWIVDEVDDRNKRYNATATLSTFQLAEKYLIWRWASFTRNALRLEAFGPQLYKQGYSSDVSLAPAESEWRVELQSSAGNAILPQSDATIFSHLILKSVDEIEEMVMNGVGR